MQQTSYQSAFTKNEYVQQMLRVAQQPVAATQTTHFFAALLVYSKLEILEHEHGLGHFRLKAQLYAAGLKATYQRLAQFIA